jgi:hypothetical protein
MSSRSRVLKPIGEIGAMLRARAHFDEIDVASMAAPLVTS